jgi:hypothetical protein
MEILFDSKGDFGEISKWLDNVSKRSPSAALNQIAREGERSLSNNTPRDTGATASGWKGEVTAKGTTSEVAWVNTAHPDAGVNVAVIIEQGHGTGTGGYVPPRPYIQKAMDSVWSNAGDKIAEEMVK